MKRSKQSLIAIVTDNSDTWPRERRIEVTGRRFCQTLKALIDAGDRGVTSLTLGSWAVRTSQYIHILRRKYGLNIETVREPHDGGEHGRYVLKSKVTIGGSDDIAA